MPIYLLPPLAALLAVVIYAFVARRWARELERLSPTAPDRGGSGVEPLPAGLQLAHQFKSILGLGIFLGPILALSWGWGPALAWIVGGALAFGWLNNYGTALLTRRAGGWGAALRGLVGEPAARLVLYLAWLYVLFVLVSVGSSLTLLFTRPNSTPIMGLGLAVGGILTALLLWRGVPWTVAGGAGVLVTALVAMPAADPRLMDLVAARQGGPFSRLLYTTPFGGVAHAWLLWGVVTFALAYAAAALEPRRLLVPLNLVAAGVILLLVVMAALNLLAVRPLASFPALGRPPGGQVVWPAMLLLAAAGTVSGWETLVSGYSVGRHLERERQILTVTVGAVFLQVFVGATVVALLMALFGSHADYLEFIAEAGAGGLFDFLFLQGLPAVGERFARQALVRSVLALSLMTALPVGLRLMHDLQQDLWGGALVSLREPRWGTLVPAGLALGLIATRAWEDFLPLLGAYTVLMAAIGFSLVGLFLHSQARSGLWLGLAAAAAWITGLAGMLLAAVGVWRQAGLVGLPGPHVAANLAAALLAALLIAASAYLMLAFLRAGRVPLPPWPR